MSTVVADTNTFGDPVPATRSPAQSLAAALAAFQAELPFIAKDNTAQVRSEKGAYAYQYADLADISSVVLPLLGKHGLSFTSKPTLDEDGKFLLEYTLRHTSGGAEHGRYPLPGNGTPQQIGSAITYARRYVLCAITGVAPGGDDDDGKAAADAHVREPDRFSFDEGRERQRRPYTWDPIQQETLVTAYAAEIEDARDPDQLSEVARRLLSAKRPRDDGEQPELSPASYDKLAILGAERRAVLDRADAEDVL